MKDNNMVVCVWLSFTIFFEIVDALSEQLVILTHLLPTIHCMAAGIEVLNSSHGTETM